MRADPRVTRVGRVLRRLSIDELPQLYNVVKGDMSLVGPRPPIPAEVDEYDEWQLGRLRATPGMTGLWQVSGRSEVPFRDMVRLDLHYIRNWSLGLDVEILLRTVPAVLSNRGAY
jgi:lipopolysaccharide/colanic/teichoic acid biosynthesis glycosyltransferase